MAEYVVGVCHALTVARKTIVQHEMTIARLTTRLAECSCSVASSSSCSASDTSGVAASESSVAVDTSSSVAAHMSLIFVLTPLADKSIGSAGNVVIPHKSGRAAGASYAVTPRVNKVYFLC